MSHASYAKRVIDALLPWPPSVNSMYANSRAGKGRGRFPTKRYAEWHQEASQALTLQQVKPIMGPLTVEIKLSSPTKRKYDLDNRIKPILDLLTSLGLIEDDNSEIVTKITVERGDGFTGAWLFAEPVQFIVTPEGREALGKAEAEDVDLYFNEDAA